MLNKSAGAVERAADALWRQPFFSLPMQTRILVSQLPLAITVMLVTVLLAASSGEYLPDGLFRWGVLAVLLLLAVAGAVPWQRLPHGAYLVVPILDFVAIGAILHGAYQHLFGLNMLLVFPVLWLAWSSILPAVMCGVSLVMSTLAVYGPLLLGQHNLSVELLARPAITPVMVFGLAVAATYVNSHLERQQEALRAEAETNRRQNELLQVIVDTASVGVLAIDAQGEEILKNKQQHLFEWLAEPDGVPDDPGEGRLLLFTGASRRPIPTPDRPVHRAARGEGFNRQRIWLGQGETERAINVSARPLTGPDGAFVGSVLVFEDVSELVAALAAQDQFVSSVSHEFRTPLTSIIGYTDLLLGEHGDGDSGPALRTVQRNAERMLQLVDDLLGSASGRMPVAREPIELGAVAREAVESATPSAWRAGLELTFEARRQALVMGDRSRLGQALDNLLSNAIKYTPRGGVAVRVDAADGRAVLEVADSGVGLTRDEQRRVFDRFYRTEGARASSVRGTGLGMSVVASIVASHDGHVALESEPGRGTTIRITLPLGIAAED